MMYKRTGGVCVDDGETRKLLRDTEDHDNKGAFLPISVSL